MSKGESVTEFLCMVRACVNGKVMRMRRYVKGRRHEYRAKEMWEKEGAFVVRAAGSKGVADLVAIKNSQAYLIQVKANQKPRRNEVEKLIETAAKCGAFAVIMVWNQHEKKWLIDTINPNL